MKVRITMVYETELNPENYSFKDLSAEEMVEEDMENDMEMFLANCTCLKYNVEEIDEFSKEKNGTEE